MFQVNYLRKGACCIPSCSCCLYSQSRKHCCNAIFSPVGSVTFRFDSVVGVSSSPDDRIDRPPRRWNRQSRCRFSAVWSHLGSAMILLLVCVCCVPILLSAAANRQLPNMTSIDGEFTAKLAVDNFFSLWIVFNNEDVTMSGKVLLLIVSFFVGVDW